MNPSQPEPTPATPPFPTDQVGLRGVVYNQWRLKELISDYFDRCIGRLILGQSMTTEAPPPTDAELAEAAFTRAILDDPRDDTARLVFADWLDEHDRSEQAAYLRRIGREKFYRLVQVYGGNAVKGIPPLPPPPGRSSDYWTVPPPKRSARCQAWVLRIRMGWRPNSSISGLGYESAARFYGVYIWEYLNVISPLLSSL